MPNPWSEEKEDIRLLVGPSVHNGASPTSATTIVIASWSRWWEKRHYELKVRPVGDCKMIFFLIESQSRRLNGRTA
jgi:hypothetical protein